MELKTTLKEYRILEKMLAEQPVTQATVKEMYKQHLISPNISSRQEPHTKRSLPSDQLLPPVPPLLPSLQILVKRLTFENRDKNSITLPPSLVSPMRSQRPHRLHQNPLFQMQSLPPNLPMSHHHHGNVRLLFCPGSPFQSTLSTEEICPVMYLLWENEPYF